MASSVYSTRFLQARNFLGSQSYTVAAGYRVILRDLDAWASVDITEPQILLVGAGGQTIYFHRWGLEDVSSVQWTGRQVINEGESFEVITQVAPADYALSGYVLLGP